jgi:phenylalanyl-tRNA synthetase beta chain
VVGLADVLEEVARLYGYENIPETRMADELPPQVGNPVNEWEERLRDQLADLGLQEVVSYRMTFPEREARLYPVGSPDPAGTKYVRVANPIAPEKACCAAACSRRPWMRSSATSACARGWNCSRLGRSSNPAL